MPLSTSEAMIEVPAVTPLAQVAPMLELAVVWTPVTTRPVTKDGTATVAKAMCASAEAEFEPASVAPDTAVASIALVRGGGRAGPIVSWTVTKVLVAVRHGASGLLAEANRLFSSSMPVPRQRLVRVAIHVSADAVLLAGFGSSSTPTTEAELWIMVPGVFGATPVTVMTSESPIGRTPPVHVSVTPTMPQPGVEVARPVTPAGRVSVTV